MPLDLGHFDVMEHLWETHDKTPDGRHIRYSRTDIEQLWWMGFVDTAACPMAEWLAAFEPHRQEDGSFLIGKEEFLALDRYRYKGEIKIPFDAMLINEGRYTDEGLWELVAASIAPSCSMAPEQLRTFFDQLKKDFRQPDGLILIQRPAKERIRLLLEEHASPLRNLEMLLDQMFEERGQEFAGQVDRAIDQAAAAQAAIAASRFSSQPVTASEEKAGELRALAKARSPADTAEVAGVPKVALKTIRRSRKGMRG